MLDINEMALVAANIKPKNELPLKERIIDAMDQAKDGVIAGLCYNSSADFYGRAAIAAVMLTASEEEKARINVDLRALKALAAAMSGVPVDILAALPGEGGPEPVGLNGIVTDWAAKRGVKLR